MKSFHLRSVVLKSYCAGESQKDFFKRLYPDLASFRQDLILSPNRFPGGINITGSQTFH